MSNKDYYKILGVSKNATTKEIKEKYRDYIKHRHPDVVPDNEKEEATKQMAEVNEAYQVLVDEEKRRNYDQFGTTENADMFGGFGFDIRDLFHRNNRGFDGADIFVKCDVTIADIYNGAVKSVEYQRTDICTDCNGTGAKSRNHYTCKTCGGRGEVKNVQKTPFGTNITIHPCPDCMGSGQGHPPIEDICEKCHGTGQILTNKSVNIEIEKGSFDDIIIPNLGYEGHLGGRNGNLFVKLSVDNTGTFKIKDRNRPRDLYTTHNCKYTDLVLGNEFTIEHFSGKINVVIPKGTAPTTLLRCSGKGLPYPNSNRYGDLYVELKLDIPKELDKKQEKYINKLKECGL